MFIFLVGCVVVIYYYDKYYIQKRNRDNKKININEKVKTIKKEMENLGFVEKNDLEKLKKQWKTELHFKIPLFIVISLFTFPPALLFLPVYFAIKFFFIKIRINYLERIKK